MAIEIVDLPIENGGSFHSYVTVYQRVVELHPNHPKIPAVIFVCFSSQPVLSGIADPRGRWFCEVFDPATVVYFC